MASLSNKWRVLPRLGLAASAVGALFACDFILNHYPRGKREFKRESVEATLMEALNTGDIMLFNRNSREFHPLKLLSLYFAKRRGDFDHVGVIIRSDDEELPYVLEYTFQGIKMTPYDQRVLFGSEVDMSIRHVHLSAPTDVVKRKELEKWAEGLMKQHESMGYFQLLARQIRSARNRHLSRPATLAQVLELESRLREEKDEARRQALQALLTMANTSWNSVKHLPEHPRGSPAAELVAKAMQQLSVLPSFPPASEYVPNDFVKDIPCEPGTIGSDLAAVVQRGKPRPKYDRPW